VGASATVRIKNYLNVLRVWHAMNFMSGGYSLKQTAAECGFKTVQYLTTVFTQKCKITPARFARLCVERKGGTRR
jgi:AraC-like DNA-binding protein